MGGFGFGQGYFGQYSLDGAAPAAAALLPSKFHLTGSYRPLIQMTGSARSSIELTGSARQNIGLTGSIESE